MSLTHEQRSPLCGPLSAKSPRCFLRSLRRRPRKSSLSLYSRRFLPLAPEPQNGKKCAPIPQQQNRPFCPVYISKSKIYRRSPFNKAGLGLILYISAVYKIKARLQHTRVSIISLCVCVCLCIRRVASPRALVLVELLRST